MPASGTDALLFSLESSYELLEFYAFFLEIVCNLSRLLLVNRGKSSLCIEY